MINEDPEQVDLLDRLAAYRPDPARLAHEWDPARARASARSPRATHRLRWTPRVPFNAAAVSAAAIAALLVAAIAVVVLRPGAGSSGEPAGGDRTASPAYVPAALVATPRVGAGQFAYREQTVYAIAADGSATQTQHGAVWAAPDGALWYDGDISDAGCFHAGAPSSPDTGSPSQAWFDDLPTTGAALTTYLRARIEGSSSADEALFVAVGDMLRNTDLLATSAVRAAAVGMLSTLPGISVHTDTSDHGGRPSVRVDWVNQALRPGEEESLFFDPSTYQLLEERSGPSGSPTTYAGPSPAYTAHATDAPSGDQLTDPSDVTVMGEEKVVDSVPSDVTACPTH